MCTVSIKIDEAVLRDVLPELNSTAAIGRWAQLLIDQHINALTKEYARQQVATPDELYNGLEPDFIYAYDETINLEAARAMVLDAVREEYARP